MIRTIPGASGHAGSESGSGPSSESYSSGPDSTAVRVSAPGWTARWSCRSAPELLTDLPAAALGLGPPRPTLNHVNAWITFPHAIIADLQQRGDVLAVWP